MKKDVQLDMYVIDDTTYELCLTGNTYAYKENIKALGFEWNGDDWRKRLNYTSREEMVKDIKPVVNNKWLAPNTVSMDKVFAKFLG